MGKKIKLINSEFTHKGVIQAQKVILKKKCYQDVMVEIEWRDYLKYKAIKITLKDRNGEKIFQEPLLLITNKPVNSLEEAQLIYQIYLKRSRIECVFKFLKDGLGWEEIQLQNFKAIQNLLSICFFIAAYLYDIEEKEVIDDYIFILARLGGGKGVVTRHYILKGIHAIMCKIRVDRILKEVNAQEEDIENMLKMATIVT